jgi:N-acylneuraminate cytidylyltransferase
MNSVAFIFARGQSKGLPGKNVREIGGKPLIAWSILHAMSIQRIKKVIVSTDSMEIAKIAREYGAEVPFIRPAELATDLSPEWLSWKHALEYLRETEGKLPDIMLSLPTTAPLRSPADIEACLDLYLEGDADIVITMTEAHRNPYFNMVKENSDGTVGLVCSNESMINQRQSAPQIFDMTTVCYVANPQFVLRSDSIFEGRVKAVKIPPERAIDIDTLLDFEIAEFLIRKKGETL